MTGMCNQAPQRLGEAFEKFEPGGDGHHLRLGGFFSLLVELSAHACY
jgi:hypothetical protein